MLIFYTCSICLKENIKENKNWLMGWWTSSFTCLLNDTLVDPSISSPTQKLKKKKIFFKIYNLKIIDLQTILGNIVINNF